MPDWLHSSLDSLAAAPACGYLNGQSPCSEPTAIAALALIGHGRSADDGLEFLARLQDSRGAVGMRLDQPRPAWPTALAVAAWSASQQPKYVPALDRGVDWMLAQQGESAEPVANFGHDPRLVGWSWVEGTHSWLEPTALHVMALRARHWQQHPRTQEARQMLLDRLLPSGGCNYGNTTVLGQALRPHLQPSGMLLLALGGEPPHAAEGRLGRTVDYVAASIGARTPAASLAWCVLGLAAHRRFPARAAPWIAAAAERPSAQTPYRQALLALAALGGAAPLVQMLGATL